MSVVRISTDRVPHAQRREYVEEHFAAIRRISIDFDEAHPISFGMALRVLPGIKLAETSFSPFRSSGRSPNDGELGTVAFFALALNGAPCLSQNGCRSDLSRYCARLEEPDQPYVASMSKSGSILGISIPRHELAARVKSLDASFSQVIIANAATRLLASYASAILHDTMNDDAPHEEAVFAAHICDLILLALPGAHPDETEIASERGLRAAFFARLKADIRANLAHPDFSLEWLAGRHVVRPRFVQNLFYAAGESFSQYVRDRRLDEAHTALTRPENAGRSIAEIAFSSGFGDISWFNNSFRKRFGMTPSDVRASATVNRNLAS